MTEPVTPPESAAATPAPYTPPSFTPVPRQRARHNGWTERRQRDFIDGLALTGSVSAAADRVGMSSESAYMLRRADGAAEFERAWADALEFGVRRLEDLAIDRAINGVEVPVYSYGKLIGSRRIHNDRLLMFILRSRRPTRYGNREAQPLSFAERSAARAGAALDDDAMADAEAEFRAAATAQFAAREAARDPAAPPPIDHEELAARMRAALKAIQEARAAEAEAEAAEAAAREAGTEPPPPFDPAPHETKLAEIKAGRY